MGAERIGIHLSASVTLLVFSLSFCGTHWSASKWEARFANLLFFRSKHGHCNVPKLYADDIELGTWVNRQRVLYSRHSKFLSSARSKGSEWHTKQPTPALTFQQRTEPGSGARPYLQLCNIDGNASQPTIETDGHKRVTPPVNESREMVVHPGGLWCATANVSVKQGPGTRRRRCSTARRLGAGHNMTATTHGGGRRRNALAVGPVGRVHAFSAYEVVLLSERFRRLRDAGFIFDAFEAEWESYLRLLVVYANEWGEADPPVRCTLERRK